MTPSDLSATPMTEESPPADSPNSSSVNSMEEYYQLQQALLRLSLGLTAMGFFSVWLAYSLNTALNYLMGACVGVVYLKLLARDVERLGKRNTKPRLGSKGLVLFAGLIVAATQWHQLHVIPVFLGFLTYKAAIIIYLLPTAIAPSSTAK